MGEKSNRVVSLLESAGIKERYVETRHRQIPASEIDYAEVTTRIQDGIKKSKDYLHTSLSYEDMNF